MTSRATARKAGTGDDRRGGRRRHRLRIPVSLIALHGDDVVVMTGETVDLGRLGCSVVLDRAIKQGDVGPAGAVVMLTHGRHEAVALAGPPLLDDGPTRSIRLTLSAARGPGAGWDELLDELDRCADSGIEF